MPYILQEERKSTVYSRNSYNEYLEKYQDPPPGPPPGFAYLINVKLVQRRSWPF